MLKQKILIVDDAEMNREILSEMLKDEYEIMEARNGQEAIDILNNFHSDIQLVLLDMNMPVMNGESVLHIMKDHLWLERIPVICISSDSTEQTMRNAYELGVTDYFSRPFDAMVVKRRVHNTIITNDLFGMEFGDSILREIYKRIQNSALNPVITARVEADHFICLIRKQDLNFDIVTQLCKMKITENQKFVLVFLCCGIYNIKTNEQNIGEMINLARVAKKYIEDEYVQPYMVYNESMKEAYLDQMTLVDDMEKGIRNGEFFIYYQPVVDAVTEKIVSAEALIRWKHPEKGYISPGVFVPTLEERGHITSRDQYVAKKVGAFLRERKQEEKLNVPISINLSWMDFYDEKIIEGILEELKILKTEKISTRIEITETSYAAIREDRNPTLNEMKENGAELLMDDFGSGYSSFGMLQNYNFDILKIDMSFVRQIEENDKTRGIVKAIINMGHILGMNLIAEGVENKQQAEFLKENGCDYIQGYYYYRPLPEEEFKKVLDENGERFS